MSLQDREQGRVGARGQCIEGDKGGRDRGAWLGRARGPCETNGKFLHKSLGHTSVFQRPPPLHFYRNNENLLTTPRDLHLLPQTNQ